MLSIARHRGIQGTGRRVAGATLGGLLLAVLLGAMPLAAQTTDATSTEQTGDSETTADPAERWQLWESPAELDDYAAGQSSPIWVAGRVLLAVLLVIGLILLLLFLLRKYGIAGGASGIGAPRLQMLANLSLGQRRTIYLVRVDGVELLVASAGDGLRLLTELPGTRDAVLSSTAGVGQRTTTGDDPASLAAAGNSSFLSTFRRALSGSNRETDATTDWDPQSLHGNR